MAHHTLQARLASCSGQRIFQFLYYNSFAVMHVYVAEFHIHCSSVRRLNQGMYTGVCSAAWMPATVCCNCYSGSRTRSAVLWKCMLCVHKACVLFYYVLWIFINFSRQSVLPSRFHTIMYACMYVYLPVGPKIKGFSMCVFCIHTTLRWQYHLVTARLNRMLHMCIRFNPWSNDIR